jgi:hypothetical protein
MKLFYKFIMLILICSSLVHCNKRDLSLVAKTLHLTISGQDYNLSGDKSLINNLVEFMDKLDPDESDGWGNFGFNDKRSTLNAQSHGLISSISLNPGNYTIGSNSNGNFNFTTLDQFFGTNLSFGVTSSAGTNTAQIYIPNNFEVTMPPNGDTVSKNQGFIINWTVDSNPLNDKGVYIELFYSVHYNQLYNLSVTGESMVKRYLVPDNGSLNISASDLAIFQPGKLEITIKKGNYHNFVVSDKNFPVLFEISSLIGVDLVD